jgi:hypothetical protein
MVNLHGAPLEIDIAGRSAAMEAPDAGFRFD